MAETCTTINCCLPSDLDPIVPEDEFLLEITVSPEDSGTVEGAGLQVGLSTVMVEATPESGFDFVGWFDGNGYLISALNPYEFQITGNLMWEARFEAE